MKNLLQLLILSVTLSNCVLNQGKIQVSLKKKANTISGDISVASVKIINNQLIITGVSLDSVTTLKVDGNSFNQSFAIESQSATQIIANSVSAISFDVSKVFNLILSSASASATFPIDFSICNATLNGKAFNCTITAHDKDVLSYDANTNKWIPRAMNGLNYRGVFDASGGIDPSSGSFDVGDYYVVNKAGTIGAVTYAIGDWISFNGNTWDKIANSTVLTSVFGRTGAVVATKGDYDLNKLTDVDLTTTPPANGNVLKYNGTKWIPAANTVTETDPSVSAFAKAALPTCNAGEVLKGNGTTLSCVTTSSAPTGTAGGDLAGTYPNPTLAAVGTAGTYKSVTVDAKGRVTAGTNPTTLAGYGITDTMVTAVTATAPVVATGTTTPVISMAASTAAVDGYLKATDFTIFNNKQSALSAGPTINGIVYPSSGAATLQIPLAPVALTDAVNKQYVDGLISGSGQWGINGSDVYRASGNVGIGLTNPTATLHLAGTTTATNFNYVNPVMTNSAGNATGLYVNDTYSPASGPTSAVYPSAIQGSISSASTNNNANVLLTGVGGSVFYNTASGSIATIHGGSFTANNTNAATVNVARGSTNQIINSGTGTIANAYATDSSIQNTSTGAITSAATIRANAVVNSGGGTIGTLYGLNIGKQNGTGITTSYGVYQSDSGDKNYFAGRVGIGMTSPGSELDVKGTLRLSGSTSGYVGFAPAAAAGTTTYLLPATQGSAGQVLSTDGVATTPTLSWITPATTSTSLVGDIGGTIGATTIGTDKVTSTHILDGTILNADINAGANIAATKLGTGVVDNTEFNYLDGVTSAIQTQLNGKEPTITAGTTAQYLRGDKSLGTFMTDVRATTLTGLSSTAGNIAATDTVLAAMGKLLNTQTDAVSKTGNSTITGTMTVNTIVGALTVPTPVGVNDAVNKSYVDGFGQWTKSGSDIYRSSGSVGIGTTAPGRLLDVSSVGASAVLANFQATGTGAAGYGLVDITSSGTSTVSALRYHNSGNHWMSGIDGANSDAYSIANANGSAFSSTKMTITTAGNVGIGTTTPSSLLTVANASGAATETISAAAANLATLQLSTVSGATSYIWSGSGGGGVGTSSNHDFLISSNNTERMRVAASNGNVGIGSTSPSSKLQVNGAITTPPNTFSGAFTCGTSTIDFSTSNLQRLSPSGTIAAGTCNVAMSNLVTGGSYTLVVTGNAATNAVTYNFTGYTYKYLPTNAATTAAKDTIYTFLYDGTTVYVTWTGGY